MLLITVMSSLVAASLLLYGGTVQGQLQCLEGYSMDQQSGECVACSVGEYKYLQGNTECISCPDNSNTTTTGSTRCDCNNGYYRTATESITVKCTAPPTSPEFVYTLSRGCMNINIEWSPPTDNGGRSDISYRVTYSNGSFTSPVFIVDDDSLSCNITGLTPSTQYTISVASVNGVSDQVFDNGDGRSISITVHTDKVNAFKAVTESTSSSADTVDWRLILSIIIPAIFMISVAIAIYLIIWKRNRHRAATTTTPRPIAAASKGTPPPSSQPLPTTTDGVYYIDERDIAPPVDGMYEQVDSPTTLQAATLSDQGYLSIVSQTDTSTQSHGSMGGYRNQDITQPHGSMGGYRNQDTTQPHGSMGGYRNQDTTQPHGSMGGYRNQDITQPHGSIGGYRNQDTSNGYLVMHDAPKNQHNHHPVLPPVNVPSVENVYEDIGQL